MAVIRLTEKEKQQAEDALLGVKVWFIVEAVLYGIATLTFLVLAIVIPIVIATQTVGPEPAAIGASIGGFIFGLLVVAAFMALFIVALMNLIKRKKNSFPFGMAMLIVSMFWIPVGTIVGAILLTKYNTELVKKYLGSGQ
jgi:hypothetical protein